MPGKKWSCLVDLNQSQRKFSPPYSLGYLTWLYHLNLHFIGHHWTKMTYLTYFWRCWLADAACNVLYLNSVDVESLTGPEAISRALESTFTSEPAVTTFVHFKVNAAGITLTDNNRRWELLLLLFYDFTTKLFYFIPDSKIIYCLFSFSDIPGHQLGNTCPYSTAVNLCSAFVLRLFFRRHYPVEMVTFAGVESEDRRSDACWHFELFLTYCDALKHS